MADGSVRAFVGLEPSRECKDALADLRQRLTRIKGGLRSRLSWSNPETWHLTLKFLGDVDVETLPLVIEALAAVPFAPFTLKPGGGGFFPSARRPRVVWVGLEQGGDQCLALAAGIESALASLGFPAEARPFSPHLTVARVKILERDPWEDLLEIMRRQPWPEVRAERFILWKSELGPSGAKHAPLATFDGSGVAGEVREGG